MPESDPSPVPVVYQVRVVVAGISPLIWRRLLVSAEATIADLHAILQTAFGWSGEHLHHFTVHGAQYGVCYDGGPVFRDDPYRVRLASLGLREGERFSYVYNFFADWRLDLRVEQITDPQPGRVYPQCTGGRRAGPPEHWNGPWDFLQRTQPYLVYEAIVRAAEILDQLLNSKDLDEVVVEVEDWREEMAGLLPLLALERFDRRALNRALAELAATERTAAA
jgi:hypothetical protein